jgi:hypothetical protein
MRTFFLLRYLNPKTQASKGFVLRENQCGSKQYRIVKADHATLYTSRSAIANSMPYALEGLGVKLPKQSVGPSTRRQFIREHFQVVEVKAILLPAENFLDVVLK